MAEQNLTPGGESNRLYDVSALLAGAKSIAEDEDMPEICRMMRIAEQIIQQVVDNLDAIELREYRNRNPA